MYKFKMKREEGRVVDELTWLSKSLFILVRNTLWIRGTYGFKVYEIGLDRTREYKKNPVEVESLGE